MSKNKTTLVTVAKVKAQSLPWSLRHTTIGCALDDAKSLVRFLDEASNAFVGECEMNDEVRAGMSLVFDLLLDKLEIASGDYHFPFAGSGDVPALVERRGES